ncbi:hypothetical protein AAMO2058_001005100 [Amorphochlora amoebiformis]
MISMDSERQTMEPAHRGPESKESYTVLSRQSDNLKQSGSRNVNPKSKGRGTKKSKRTKKTKRDSLPPLRPNQVIKASEEVGREKKSLEKRRGKKNKRSKMEGKSRGETVRGANKKAKKSPREITVLELEKGSNPLLEQYRQITNKFPRDMDRLLDPKLPGGDLRRGVLFDLLPDEMTEKYSWAVADERALRIIQRFSPVVEIACGKGYWGRMLKDKGCDWVGYDAAELTEAWTQVRFGGPDVLLQNKELSQRALMLCYPDEFHNSMESVALACLDNYKGDIVIHIGESLPHTHMENPWGKTSSSDFQLELAHAFHKIVQVPLPSWPASIDTLSVWKRSSRSEIDDMTLRFIPRSERLELVQCCPSTRDLVQ